MNQLIHRVLFAGLILFSFVLTGCGLRFQATQKAVEKTASAINTDFENIRKAEETMVKQIEDVYANTNKLDLSINHMDVKDGGVFATFDKNLYYYNTNKGGVSYYCSPGKPVDNTIRREIRMMQYMEPYLEQAQKTDPDIISLAFYAIHKPTSIGMLYPWFDVVSIFPPGLQFTMFDWYNRGFQSSGAALWSKLPFVSLAAGWIIDVAAPVKMNGITKGATVLSIDLAKVNTKFIKKQKNNLMLLGPDLTLVAANNSAKNSLNLKIIEDIDYVQQMKENKFAADQYKLSDASQSPEMQAVASKILSGSKKFEQTINGKTYQFTVSDIKEVGFYLVGFTLK